jgi:hypothetical protein
LAIARSGRPEVPTPSRAAAAHEAPVADHAECDGKLRVLGGGRHRHRRVGPGEELVADAPPRVLAQPDHDAQRLADVAGLDGRAVGLAQVVERSVDLHHPRGFVGTTDAAGSVVGELGMFGGVGGAHRRVLG